MNSRTRIIYRRRMFTSTFSEGYSDRQTPEEGRRAKKPSKRCDNNHEDTDISPSVKNVNNDNTSSHKRYQNLETTVICLV